MGRFNHLFILALILCSLFIFTTSQAITFTYNNPYDPSNNYPAGTTLELEGSSQVYSFYKGTTIDISSDADYNIAFSLIKVDGDETVTSWDSEITSSGIQYVLPNDLEDDVEYKIVISVDDPVSTFTSSKFKTYTYNQCNEISSVDGSYDPICQNGASCNQADGECTCINNYFGDNCESGPRTAPTVQITFDPAGQYPTNGIIPAYDENSEPTISLYNEHDIEVTITPTNTGGTATVTLYKYQANDDDIIAAAFASFDFSSTLGVVQTVPLDLGDATIDDLYYISITYTNMQDDFIAPDYTSAFFKVYHEDSLCYTISTTNGSWDPNCKNDATCDEQTGECTCINDFIGTTCTETAPIVIYSFDNTDNTGYPADGIIPTYTTESTPVIAMYPNVQVKVQITANNSPGTATVILYEVGTGVNEDTVVQTDNYSYNIGEVQGTYTMPTKTATYYFTVTFSTPNAIASRSAHFQVFTTCTNISTTNGSTTPKCQNNGTCDDLTAVCSCINNYFGSTCTDGPRTPPTVEITFDTTNGNYPTNGIIPLYDSESTQVISIYDGTDITIKITPTNTVGIATMTLYKMDPIDDVEITTETIDFTLGTQQSEFPLNVPTATVDDTYYMIITFSSMEDNFVVEPMRFQSFQIYKTSQCSAISTVDGSYGAKCQNDGTCNGDDGVCSCVDNYFGTTCINGPRTDPTVELTFTATENYPPSGILPIDDLSTTPTISIYDGSDITATITPTNTGGTATMVLYKVNPTPTDDDFVITTSTPITFTTTSQTIEITLDVEDATVDDLYYVEVQFSAMEDNYSATSIKSSNFKIYNKNCLVISTTDGTTSAKCQNGSTCNEDDGVCSCINNYFGATCTDGPRTAPAQTFTFSDPTTQYPTDGIIPQYNSEVTPTISIYDETIITTTITPTNTGGKATVTLYKVNAADDDIVITTAPQITFTTTAQTSTITIDVADATVNDLYYISITYTDMEDNFTVPTVESARFNIYYATCNTISTTDGSIGPKCQNSGTCNESTGVCSCINNYFGDNCESGPRTAPTQTFTFQDATTQYPTSGILPIYNAESTPTISIYNGKSIKIDITATNTGGEGTITFRKVASPTDTVLQTFTPTTFTTTTPGTLTYTINVDDVTADDLFYFYITYSNMEDDFTVADVETARFKVYESICNVISTTDGSVGPKCQNDSTCNETTGVCTCVNNYFGTTCTDGPRTSPTIGFTFDPAGQYPTNGIIPEFNPTSTSPPIISLYNGNDITITITPTNTGGKVTVELYKIGDIDVVVYTSNPLPFTTTAITETITLDATDATADDLYYIYISYTDMEDNFIATAVTSAHFKIYQHSQCYLISTTNGSYGPKCQNNATCNETTGICTCINDDFKGDICDEPNITRPPIKISIESLQTDIKLKSEYDSPSLYPPQVIMNTDTKIDISLGPYTQDGITAIIEMFYTYDETSIPLIAPITVSILKTDTTPIITSINAPAIDTTTAFIRITFSLNNITEDTVPFVILPKCFTQPIETNQLTTLLFWKSICGEHGTCGIDNSCHCATNYTGITCSRDINDNTIPDTTCDICNQEHLQSCSNKTALTSFTTPCVCNNKYGGLLCDDLNKCLIKSLDGCNYRNWQGKFQTNTDGTCGTTCECTNQWIGNECQTCSLTCENNGKRFKHCDKCGCQIGFGGTTCQCLSAVLTFVINGDNDAVILHNGNWTNGLTFDPTNNNDIALQYFQNAWLQYFETELQVTGITIHTKTKPDSENTTQFDITVNYGCDEAPSDGPQTFDELKTRWVDIVNNNVPKSNLATLTLNFHNQTPSIDGDATIEPAPDTLPTAAQEINTAILSSLTSMIYIVISFITIITFMI